jgi:anti-sigma factor RsiW
MRCEAVRQIVEDGMNRPPAVEVHVESCSACKEYLRQWDMIHAGLVALRGEEPPEPSIGFTTRVMRRLENSSAELKFGQQFIDQIGRRVVYATLMVALMLLLILALPSSGPLRSSGISESVLVQTQVATLSTEQVLGVDGMDSGDQADSSPASATSGGPGARGSK